MIDLYSYILYNINSIFKYLYKFYSYPCKILCNMMSDCALGSQIFGCNKSTDHMPLSLLVSVCLIL